MPYEFQGKRIAVIGMARSGMAAATVLKRRGAEVILYDEKSANELEPQLAVAAELGIKADAFANAVYPSDIAIVSPGVRVKGSTGIMQSVRHQGIEIWGEIEAAYRLAEAPILAVTGTNGKTTTVLMLAEMLRAGGITTYAAGNIAAGPLAQPLISAADLAKPGEAIVAEISSFQLETIKEFRPKIAAILNITADHQDRQDWTSYVLAKWRIFENQGGGDTAVLSNSVPQPPYARPLPDNVKYFDTMPQPEWLEDLRIPGEHNQLNALAASAMASSFGVGEEAIKRGALQFNGVVHRLEFVAKIDGVTYINNSMCTNNAAFASSLEAISGPKIALAGGVFKGGLKLPLAEAVAKNNVKLLVLFGKSAVGIDDVVRRNTDVETIVVGRMDYALRKAVERAVPGDTVVLNPGCASFDQFKDFEDRGEQFKQLVESMKENATQ